MAENENDEPSLCQEFIANLSDSQKHELVGRALLEQSSEEWQKIFEAIALKRCDDRTIRFREMSGKETELKLDPFERLPLWSTPPRTRPDPTVASGWSCEVISAVPRLTRP